MRDALEPARPAHRLWRRRAHRSECAGDARHHRPRTCRSNRRGAVAGRMVPALLAQVGELDRDAPDYDRALVELAALLQRLAIVQIVPDAAARTSSTIREIADASGEGAGSRGRAALLPDCARRPARSSHGARPAPRIRNDAAAHAGISAGGCRPGAGRSGGRRTPRARSRAHRRGCADPAAAEPATAAERGHRLPPRSMRRNCGAAVVDAAGLSGMARQFALNCVPASFDNGVLRLRLDPAAATSRALQARSRRSWLQGLSGYLGPRHPRDIRDRRDPDSRRRRGSGRWPIRTGTAQRGGGLR